MELLLKSLLFLTIVTICCCQDVAPTFLPVEPPKFYAVEPSPLQNRDSLKSREYFDFLNTLYRHDKTKASLFDGKATQIHPVYVAPPNPSARGFLQEHRQRREIVFRPLFVYRQQQVKRQRLSNKNNKNQNNKIN